MGQFFWNGSGFKSFCVEGQQSISPGLHTFPTVTSLSASGLANADLVEQFWRRYGPTTPTGFTSVTDAAAFQLGIWEIISDGPSRDLKSGSFRVGDSASPAVARAESWLNGTGTPAAGAGGSVALHVMQHPTMQDQVIWGPLPPPSVSVKVTPTSVTEDGPNKLTYEFTASPAPTSAITVAYRIGGSAKAGSDFTGLPPGATAGTITIPAGSTSPVTLTIVPTADTEIEPNETVILTLQQGAGYALGTSVATGTITNDDLPEVTLAVAPASVTEDGTTNLVYTFTRTGPKTSALPVNYSIAGTADAADYTGATPGAGKTISFLAGSATATLTITPTPDTVVEFDETVIVTLAPGSGYTVGTTTPVTGTILNDDLNRPPQAADDQFSAALQIAVTIVLDVLLNDDDPDGDHVMITAITSPQYGGTAQISPDGKKILYTPPVFHDSAMDMGGIVEGLDIPEDRGDVEDGGVASFIPFLDRFQYTIQDTASAQSSAFVQVRANIPEWEMGIPARYDDKTKLGVDGKAGYSIEITQTFGANAKGNTAAANTQTWQTNDYRATNVFLDKGGNVHAEADSMLLMDTKNIGGSNRSRPGLRSRSDCVGSGDGGEQGRGRCAGEVRCHRIDQVLIGVSIL